MANYNCGCLSLCLQAGNNLLIVQSPGQPPMVQQVQLIQPKQEPQMVQIPQQALKVVQAASATLPTVPQRQSNPHNIQAPAEASQTQVTHNVLTHSLLKQYTESFLMEMCSNPCFHLFI